VATSSEDHRAARDAFLDTLSAEEQARVLRQAEKMGPISTDPDWLVAYAAERSAARFEAAVAAAMSMVRTAPSAAPSSPPRGWRWPLTVVALACGLLLLALASFSVLRGEWPEEAVRGAHVIVTATTSSQRARCSTPERPLFKLRGTSVAAVRRFTGISPPKHLPHERRRQANRFRGGHAEQIGANSMTMRSSDRPSSWTPRTRRAKNRATSSPRAASTPRSAKF